MHKVNFAPAVQFERCNAVHLAQLAQGVRRRQYNAALHARVDRFRDALVHCAQTRNYVRLLVAVECPYLSQPHNCAPPFSSALAALSDVLACAVVSFFLRRLTAFDHPSCFAPFGVCVALSVTTDIPLRTPVAWVVWCRDGRL